MRAPVTAVLVATLLAAGCGTDEPADVASTTGQSDAEDEPADEAAAVRETDAAPDAEVEIRTFDFVDDVTEIAAGQTVTWTNGDATRHTITSGLDGEPDDAFRAVVDDRGDAVSLTFDEPGEYHYFCEPHPFMTGTVVVTD